jgi:hypothetical protein
MPGAIRRGMNEQTLTRKVKVFMWKYFLFIILESLLDILDVRNRNQSVSRDLRLRMMCCSSSYRQ